MPRPNKLLCRNTKHKTQNKEKSMNHACYNHFIDPRTIKPKLNRTRSKSRFLPVVMLALAVFMQEQARGATVRWVDLTAASLPPGTGCGPMAGYKTIQDAINAASPGDTIHVCAGLYPEPAPGPLTINKRLTLLGAQAGVDARTRVGPESVVTDPQGTSVSASGVIIDGFTFQDSISPAFTGF